MDSMRFIKLQAASSESNNPVIAGMYDDRVYGVMYEDQIVGFAGKTGPSSELEVTIVMSSPAGLRIEDEDKAFISLKNNSVVLLNFQAEGTNNEEQVEAIRIFNVESVSL
jgi:hypothetical protein